MNLPKFISNKNIFSKIIVIGYNQVCIQTLFINFFKEQSKKQSMRSRFHNPSVSLKDSYNI